MAQVTVKRTDDTDNIKVGDQVIYEDIRRPGGLCVDTLYNFTLVLDNNIKIEFRDNPNADYSNLYIIHIEKNSKTICLTFGTKKQVPGKKRTKRKTDHLEDRIRELEDEVKELKAKDKYEFDRRVRDILGAENPDVTIFYFDKNEVRYAPGDVIAYNNDDYKVMTVHEDGCVVKKL